MDIMHPDQWLERWKQDRIGFHESTVNPYLPRYLSLFNLKPGDAIFLPLCGKTIDIVWLAEKGFRVTGIELSEIAIESFFAEQELRYQKFETDDFILRRSGNISLIQGDYFALQAGHLADCKMIYDRAALIAIDEENRSRYCAHMRSITRPDAAMLLVTLDYQQTQMSGPPFAVSEQEVGQHYADYYTIDVLEQNNVIDEKPRWRDQGLTSLSESAFRLIRGVSA
jgi:thiopurine S-methyltransferase